VRRTNQGIVVIPLAAGIEKVFDQLAQLVFIRSAQKEIAHCTTETALHLPVHLLLVFHRGGNTVLENPSIRSLAEIRALITGQRAIAANLGPRDVAGRWERGDNPADREVPLLESLTMELP